MKSKADPKQAVTLTVDMTRSMHPFRIEEGLWRQLVQLAAELSATIGEPVSVNSLIRDTLIRAYGLVVPGATPEWAERAELLQAAREGRARIGVIRQDGYDPTAHPVITQRRAVLKRSDKP